MTDKTSTLKKLKDAVAAKKAASGDAPKKTLKSIREQRYETNEQTATPTMHDPEVAPHLFKKWVGDRVAVVNVRQCDNPNCNQRGDYRAPKSRFNVNSYYWFCLEHVQIYNAAWDYYAGMSVAEIEEALRASTTWERPTWPLGNAKERKIDASVRSAFKRVFDEDDVESQAERIHAKAEARGVDPRYAAQLGALRELGLAPPIDFEGIKKRYRDLVKLHHPDVQNGSVEADDKIKRLNSAFTVLKEFYAFEEVNMANSNMN